MKFLPVIAVLLCALLSTGAASEKNVFRVGDAIELNVAGYEEELNGTYRVGADSAVVIPYIGPVRAAGLEAGAFKEQLTQTIWRYYINRPLVIIRPLHAITVLGEVYKPGTYEIEGGEKLTGLIAMAGGMRESAQLKKARVTRDGVTLKQNLKDALESGKTVEDIGILSGDVIYVPQASWFGNWRNWAVVISSVSLAIAVYDRVSR